MARRSTRKRKSIPDVPASDAGILTTEYTLPDWNLRLLHAAIIIAAGLWIYWPVLHGDWVWDDSMYISQNPLLHDPARLWKVWFQPGSFIEYYPIEQTVQWMQWQLWGSDTLGYHLTNVFLHLLSAFLVWRLLSKLGLQSAWLGGLIFAIHPMMVESVAWISELKNTLSLPPFLLAMCAWIDYEEGGKPRDYFQALGLFLVAMLCKISMAAFPAVILLYAWWKRGRIGLRDLVASAPFFAFSLVLSVLTSWGSGVYMHSQLKTPAPVDIGGFFFRLVLVGQTLSYYFARCFWPLSPLPIYSRWEIDPSSLIQYLPWLALAGVGYWLWRRRQGWGRHALLGLGFFVLLLAPFLGFIPISYMSFTSVMDHFLYIPMIGVIALVVAGFENVDARLPRSIHPFSTGILTVVMGLLAFESHWYSSAFTGDETFWTYIIDRNPDAWLAHNNLGKLLLEAGEPEQAMQHFETVIRLQPGYGEPYTNLGAALAQQGQFSQAIEAFQQSLKRDPFSPEAHNDLGIVLAQTGHPDEALADFAQAISEHPSYADAYTNMGNTYLQAGHVPEAIQQFQTAIKIDPTHIAAHDNLGIALGQSGRIPEAMDEFEKSLQLNPNDDAARQNLARLEQFEMQRKASGNN